MGISLFTNNAFSSISDPDSYSPGFDTSNLLRAEIFTYSGIGQNLMPGADLPTVVGTPTEISGSPYVQFSNNAAVANLNLGVQDADAQTWFVLFDPNSETSQRLIMSSYGGTGATTLPGAGIMINASGAMQLGIGYHNTDADTYSVQMTTLTGFDFSKKALLCVTLNGTTATLEDVTHGLSASLTLSAGRTRAYNTIRVGKGATNLWGSATATNRIAAYFLFNRILASDEKSQVRNYLQTCIQAKFPDEIL